MSEPSSTESLANDQASDRQQRNRERRKAAGLLPLQTVWHRRARLTVLSHYSGGVPSCACCKETHIEFLSIDHIGGNGRQHRETLQQSGTNIYHFLKKNGFPAGYRVLCHNCNQSIGLYGYCPHQKQTTTDDWLQSLKSQQLTPIIRHRMITIDGETKSVAEWASTCGRTANTIIKRLNRGSTPYEAVFGHIRKSPRQPNQ